MIAIAKKMKRDPEFFNATMDSLRTVNPDLYESIRQDPNSFYKQILGEDEDYDMEKDILEVL